MTKTLIFCTSYAEIIHNWNFRYKYWIDYIIKSDLVYDQLIIVDDGSSALPSWENVPVYRIGNIPQIAMRESIHRFEQRLGVLPGTDTPFPGWYRSFGYAIKYALSEGFDRVIHIESDAYLITDRAITYFNNQYSGWITLWCKSHNWPESTLQIVNSEYLEIADNFFSVPYQDHVNNVLQPIEKALPIQGVNRTLVGDRYGEIGESVPFGADYVSQVRWDLGDSYFWWLNKIDNKILIESNLEMTNVEILTNLYLREKSETTHLGTEYREFLRFLDKNLLPNGFFEIGTHQGDSLSQFTCESLCIDPNFVFPGNVIGKKRRLSLFQMTSDSFFDEYDPRQYVTSLDIGFLDGLHTYDALLRDFINFEKYAHPLSMAILHDCFPLNARMTNREHVMGPQTESENTRNFWTGDVWKLIPILKQYRPDLLIIGIDCPPTGLVLVTNLNSKSNLLDDKFSEITKYWSQINLKDDSIQKLWEEIPILSSKNITADPQVFCEIYHLRS